MTDARPGPSRRSGVAIARPRVAIAHDYLTQRGGAERVVLAMHRAFPDATIHTTLYDPDGTFPEFAGAHIVTSPLNRVGALRRDHRAGLPLLPWAVSRLPVDADVVVASSSGWAHGVPSTGAKLVYCHAPARWLYQTEAYLGGPADASLKGRVVTALKPWLTGWDRRAAATADRYVVNSTVVRERVREAYDIEADVLPPPFGVDADGPRTPVAALADWAEGHSGDGGDGDDEGHPGYHLVVSRLLPYKNVDHAIEAFRELSDHRLVIVGHGPLEAALRATLPANVRLMSHLTDDELRWTYAHATCLVAPSLEDFGLTPVEAAAFGKPTLALHAGGYLDTIDEQVNGLFFAEAAAQAIRAAVAAGQARGWDPERIRAHAQQFSEASFVARLRTEVDDLLRHRGHAGNTRPKGTEGA